MRSAPTLTLAVATVATALAGTRRSHRASGRASTRRMAAPHRRTQVMGSEGRHAMNTRTVRRRPGAGVRRLAAAAACLLLAAALDASANEEAVSAFAAGVGARDRSSGLAPAPAVTVYVVPEDRTFLLTDILVANHGQEVGPLYLTDSQRKVLDALDEPSDLDRLAARSGLPISTLQADLTMLQIRGAVTKEGSRFARKRQSSHG